jgi:hypothetical protein
MGSASSDPQIEIFETTCVCTDHIQNFCCHQSLSNTWYVALGIFSNLEMTESIQKDVPNLHSNITSFYVRSVSICRFWYLQGALELIPTEDNVCVCVCVYGERRQRERECKRNYFNEVMNWFMCLWSVGTFYKLQNLKGRSADWRPVRSSCLSPKAVFWQNCFLLGDWKISFYFIESFH